MPTNRLILIFIFSALLWASCDLYPQDDYTEEVVVESFLVAGNTLGPVFLSTTVPAYEEYLFKNNTINQATVEISLLTDGSDSEVEQYFLYKQDERGVYISEDSHRVLPERTYRLSVTIPDYNQITAYTTIPGEFANQNAAPDSIFYQSEERIEVKIPEEKLTDDLRYFIFTTFADSASEKNLVPLYKEFLSLRDDENELDEDLKRFSVNHSGIIGEGNFETDDSGNLVVRFPWIGIAFFGHNTIVAHLLDQNTYDFVRSQQVQLGGSSISAGEIPNVISNIEGALGVFGSFSTDTLRTKVLRRPGF